MLAALAMLALMEETRVCRAPAARLAVAEPVAMEEQSEVAA